MKPTLFILVGIPGSGKSSWAQNHLTCPIVSTDAIREELTGSASDQSMNAEVFDLAYERVVEYIKLGSDVCLDATNVGRKGRRHTINYLKHLSGCRFNTHAIVFPITPEEAITRQEQRERKVGADIIQRFYNNFSYPTYDEGWDMICQAQKAPENIPCCI